MPSSALPANRLRRLCSVYSSFVVIFFVLPLISAGYGTFNYLQNLEILTERWYSLWTQHTLFYSMLFFPAMVSAYAAYLWRLEHLGHNWNLIMAAPVRPFALFAAKLFVVVKLMCFTQCFVFVLYVACGRLFAGFSDWPPVSIVFYLVRGIFGGSAWPAKAAPPPQPDRRKCRAPEDRKSVV